jgi:hypothetical protein
VALITVKLGQLVPFMETWVVPVKKSPVSVITVAAGAQTVDTAVIDGGKNTVMVVVAVTVHPFELDTVTV